MSRDRIENRGHAIYEFLTLNLGEGYTLADLCQELGFEPGSTTSAAMRRARDLAAEAGYHLPPAIAENGYEYRVTKLAQDALAPTLQMARVERGVRLRKESGIEFMRRERAGLPPDLRPVVDMHLSVHDAAVKALGTIQAAADDMVVALIEARRADRSAAEPK